MTTPLVPNLCDLCNPDDQNCIDGCLVYENAPVSLNILYSIFRTTSLYNFFTNDVSNIIESKASFLSARLGLYQQIPWLIGFIFLIIFLVYSNDISVKTGFFLFIISLIVIIFFLGVSYFDAKETVSSLTQAVTNQISANFQNNSQDLMSRLSTDAELFNQVCLLPGTGTCGS